VGSFSPNPCKSGASAGKIPFATAFLRFLSASFWHTPESCTGGIGTQLYRSAARHVLTSDPEHPERSGAQNRQPLSRTVGITVGIRMKTMEIMETMDKIDTQYTGKIAEF